MIDISENTTIVLLRIMLFEMFKCNHSTSQCTFFIILYESKYQNSPSKWFLWNKNCLFGWFKWIKHCHLVEHVMIVRVLTN